MGKNTKGGSKHKKYARNRNINTNKNKLSHLEKTEGQEYAYIKDKLGNCRFRVICWDKLERLAILRGKMRKRQWVDIGTIVIVSLREFQNDKCEIVQKFEQEQVDVLLKNNIISEAFVKDGSTFNKEDEEKEEISYVEDKQENNIIDDFDFDDI